MTHESHESQYPGNSARTVSKLSRIKTNVDYSGIGWMCKKSCSRLANTDVPDSCKAISRMTMSGRSGSGESGCENTPQRYRFHRLLVGLEGGSLHH